ncbi:hypothetical protein BELL_0897g00020 [Botrytis elliptica]|uniref:Uncharacterized protein n=1 Tax=Botrytis elliptica TaxID=278938 RepID=A0A4Z1J147_9HELO|nr:hypothetical protein BELL_0897g00020 [Botrytis elliptica]
MMERTEQSAINSIAYGLRPLNAKPVQIAMINQSFKNNTERQGIHKFLTSQSETNTKSFEQMRKRDWSGQPRSYPPQVVPRLLAGNWRTEMTQLYDKPWRSFERIDENHQSLATDDSSDQMLLSEPEMSNLTSGLGGIELQPVAQSENSAYRKRRSAGKFSGGACCATFSGRRMTETKKSVGRYGGGVKTMEDPGTNDPEVEPPQKARTPLPSPAKNENLATNNRLLPTQVVACVVQSGVESIQGTGLKVSILPIDLQSSEFLVFFLGGWTTINIELCTAVSTIPEISQLVQSLKSSRFKFFELLLGLDPKNAKVVGSGLEDLRWYARAWNHELKLSPRSTPAHMYTPFREANGLHAAANTSGSSARGCIKSNGKPQTIAEIAPLSAQSLFYPVVPNWSSLRPRSYTTLLTNYFSKVSLAAMEESRTQRDKRGQMSPTQEEYNRVTASVSVAVLAKQLHDFAYDTTGNSKYPGQGSSQQ